MTRDYTYLLILSFVCAILLLAAPLPLLAKDLKTSIEGLHDETLRNYLEKNLEGSRTLPKNPDAEAIRAQAEKAKGLVLKGLAAQGYYTPSVQMKLDEKDRHAAFQVDPGARITIHSITFNGTPWPLEKTKIGDPLLAQNVLDDQQKIFDTISKDSCLFGLKVDHQAILDMNAHTADLVFDITDKGKARYGDIQFKGLERVKPDFARKLVALKQDGCYKEAEIEQAQADLLSSGLFSLVKVNVPEQPDSSGRVPLIIDVTERKPRTIKAGLTYYTDEGPGVQLGWEHRNILGRGEKLTSDLKISAIEQSITNKLTKPFFLRRDQTLNLAANLKREDTDAYEANTISLNGDVARKINKRLTVSLGGGYDVSHIDDGEKNETFALLYGTGYADWDNRDNALDPHKGYKARLDLKPFINTLDPSNIFWETQINASTYFAFAPDTRIDPVLAIRGRFGSIFGQDTDNIPATERFYAGGGGSVRGFAYQDIGPRNDDGDPAGGRSVIETSAEMRFKITPTIGAAAFVDGGSVSDAVYPDIENGYAIGAGLGIRYYTSFGPLRFDVGVPLTQKDDADGAYQIYISLGQAF